MTGATRLLFMTRLASRRGCIERLLAIEDKLWLLPYNGYKYHHLGAQLLI
jgi:hypothetical protein